MKLDQQGGCKDMCSQGLCSDFDPHTHRDCPLTSHTYGGMCAHAVYTCMHTHMHIHIHQIYKSINVKINWAWQLIGGNTLQKLSPMSFTWDTHSIIGSFSYLVFLLMLLAIL